MAAAVQTHHAPHAVPTTVQRIYRERVSWIRLLSTTASFSIATGAILIALDSNHAGTPVAAPTETATEYRSTLGLRVTTQKQQLDIRWDHDLAVRLQSTKGLMKITDGEMTKLIPLDSRDLQDGYVSYTPLTNDVRVRFEVTKVDGTSVTESARVVAIP
jgi:hypothetical protein